MENVKMLVNYFLILFNLDSKKILVRYFYLIILWLIDKIKGIECSHYVLTFSTVTMWICWANFSLCKE